MTEGKRDEIRMWVVTLFIIIVALTLVSFVYTEHPTPLLYLLGVLLSFEAVIIVMLIGREVDV